MKNTMLIESQSYALIERITAIELAMTYNIRIAALYLRANGYSVDAARRILLGAHAVR